jgi:hypothetical protein
MVTEDTSSSAFDPLKTMETCIGGKMRRYALLFPGACCRLRSVRRAGAYKEVNEPVGRSPHKLVKRGPLCVPRNHPSANRTYSQGACRFLLRGR